VTASSLQLSWTPIVNETITSYIVQYRDLSTASGGHEGGASGGGGGTGGGGGETSLSFDETSDLHSPQCTIDSLSAHTVYELRVLAVNDIGRGVPSLALKTSTSQLGLYLIT